jgi:hypothetical protein
MADVRRPISRYVSWINTPCPIHSKAAAKAFAVGVFCTCVAALTPAALTFDVGKTVVPEAREVTAQVFSRGSAIWVAINSPYTFEVDHGHVSASTSSSLALSSTAIFSTRR